MELSFDEFDNWADNGVCEGRPRTFNLNFFSSPTRRRAFGELCSVGNEASEGEDGRVGEDVWVDFSDPEEFGHAVNQELVQAEHDRAFSFSDDDDNDNQVEDNQSGNLVLADSSASEKDQAVHSPGCYHFDFSDDERDLGRPSSLIHPSRTHTQQPSFPTSTETPAMSIPRKRPSLGPLDLNPLEHDLPTRPHSIHPHKHLRLSAPDTNQAEMDNVFGLVAPTAALENASIDQVEMDDFYDSGDDGLGEIISIDGSDEEVKVGGASLAVASSRVGEQPAGPANKTKPIRKEHWRLVRISPELDRTEYDQR